MSVQAARAALKHAQDTETVYESAQRVAGEAWGRKVTAWRAFAETVKANGPVTLNGFHYAWDETIRDVRITDLESVVGLKDSFSERLLVATGIA